MRCYCDTLPKDQVCWACQQRQEEANVQTTVETIKVIGNKGAFMGWFKRADNGDFLWSPAPGPYCYGAEDLKEIAKSLDYWNQGESQANDGSAI